MSVELYTVNGMVQKHDSVDAMLQHYNRNGKWYELKRNGEFTELWHKGDKRKVGLFKQVDDKS